MDIILGERLQELIDTLIQAEIQAAGLLQTARAHSLTFGPDYNDGDDDIARLIGRLPLHAAAQCALAMVR